MNNHTRSTLMILRGTIGLNFEDGTKIQKLGLRTGSGSVYSIVLYSGPPQSREIDKETFTLRQGDVIINGRRYGDVTIGYSPARGTLLVISTIDGHVIRQSTSVTESY